MKKKKMVLPLLTLAIMASQATGCAVVKSNELVNMIDSGVEIVVEVAKPDYEIVVNGKAAAEVNAWTQLDTLRTYNNMRMDFDTLLNINKITVLGKDSKSGSIYVGQDNKHSGNTTLYDAFRNKVFVTKYWENKDTKTAMMKLGDKAYNDIDVNKNDSLYAVLNAYYDLLADNIDPNSFNSTQSVSREQFYSLVFRAANGVQDLEEDSTYTDEVGKSTPDSIYASQVDQYAFLNTEDACLDGDNAIGSISRAEAVYMLMNMYFSDEMATLNGKEATYSDCKGAGDLALKVGFKTSEKNKETKETIVTGKDNWQTYTLAYMMQNPDKGIQDEIYRAMVVAKRLNLLGEGVTESRWDEPISKVESIQLLTNVYMALNGRDGYLTMAEYGKFEEAVIDTTLPEMEAPEVVDNWEEPPVNTIYNPAADLDGSGYVDKAEWEKWVAENPADLDQNLHIEDWEKAEFNKPAQGNNGGGSTQKPSNSGGTSNSGGATTPVTPPAPPSSGGDNRTEEQKAADKGALSPLDELDNWGAGEKTQEEIDEFNENSSKPFEPVGS